MIIGIALIIGACFWWHAGALERHKPLFMRVVAAVQAGQISPGPDGFAKLPPSLESAGEDGFVLVEAKPNQVCVAFPTWRGKGHNMRGFLYCSGYAPRGSDEFGQDSIGIANTALAITRQIDQNWFEIHRELD